MISCLFRIKPTRLPLADKLTNKCNSLAKSLNPKERGKEKVANATKHNNYKKSQSDMEWLDSHIKEVEHTEHHHAE